MKRLIAPILVGTLAIVGVAGYALAGGGSQSTSLVSSSSSTSSQPGVANLPNVPCPLASSSSTQSSVPASSTPPNGRARAHWLFCCGIAQAPSPSGVVPTPLKRCCLKGPATSGSNAMPSYACRARGWHFGIFRALSNRVAYAEAIVKIKGVWTTVDINNGTVAAISANSITVKRLDGVSATINLTSSTKYLGIKEAEIAVGDRTAVVSESSNALYVLTRAPKGVQPQVTEPTTPATVPSVSVPIYNQCGPNTEKICY
jgi:hypothetical protein